MHLCEDDPVLWQVAPLRHGEGEHGTYRFSQFLPTNIDGHRHLRESRLIYVAPTLTLEF